MLTEMIDLARDAYRVDDLIGRRAVFTTSDSERLVGTVQRSTRSGDLRIVFADGRHGVVPMTSTIEIEA